MILGHQKQWQFLKGLIKLGNIPHAFLFSGPSEIGKKTLAMEFLKLLNCEKSKGFSCQNCRSCKDIEKKVHPDVRILEHQEKDINIDQIRELKSYLSLSPHSAIFKSVIIDQAHSLNRQAQSALLKLLEEPKGKTIFILITEYPEMLLDTILSRCEILKFYLVSDKEIKDYLKNQKIPEKAQERLLSMSFGKPGKLIKFIEDPSKKEFQEKTMKEVEELINSSLSKRFNYAKKLSEEPERIKEVLEIWLRYFRNLLILKVSSQSNGYSLSKLKNIINLLQKTNYIVSTTNVNLRLALENLMLEI